MLTQGRKEYVKMELVRTVEHTQRKIDQTRNTKLLLNISRTRHDLESVSIHPPKHVFPASNVVSCFILPTATKFHYEGIYCKGGERFRGFPKVKRQHLESSKTYLRQMCVSKGRTIRKVWRGKKQKKLCKESIIKAIHESRNPLPTPTRRRGLFLWSVSKFKTYLPVRADRACNASEWEWLVVRGLW